MKYTITKEVSDICKKFAEDSVLSSADRYARRNQNDIEKIKKDIKVGKIAEFIVYDHLVKQFSTLRKPDIQIYDKNSKSWDTDLKDDFGIKIAVKGQNIDSQLSFGESWVFQYNKGKSYDCDKEVFGEENNNYVAFVSLNVPRKTAEIRAIVKVSWLHEKDLFKDMKQEYLKNNKVAVYYEDLERFKDGIFQI